ncbi:putative CAP domain-containing protein [Plasmopara halstedii]
MMSIVQSTFGLFLALSTSSSSAVNNLHTTRNLQTYSSYDNYYQQMLDAVNAERAKAGLSALCTNQKLANAAARHSKDMAEHNFMDHIGSDGSTLSERITDAVMESWMNSAGHRANILGADYTMFGTSYVFSAQSKYRHYWTQDFASGDTEGCDNGSSSTSQSTEQTQQEQSENQQETQSSNDINGTTTQNYTSPSTGFPTQYPTPSFGSFRKGSFTTKPPAENTSVSQNSTQIPTPVTSPSNLPAPLTPGSAPVTPRSKTVVSTTSVPGSVAKKQVFYVSP